MRKIAALFACLLLMCTVLPVESACAEKYPVHEYLFASPDAGFFWSADKVKTTSKRLVIAGEISSDGWIMPPRGPRTYYFKKKCRFYNQDKKHCPVKISKKKAIGKLKSGKYYTCEFTAGGGKISRLEFVNWPARLDTESWAESEPASYNAAA